MKKFLICVGLVLLATLASYSLLHAQSARLTHSFPATHNTPPPLGRDFWIPIMMIGDDQTSKVISLCVCSPNATTAHVEFPGSTPITHKLLPNKLDTFNIPVTWEIKTSAIVENKALHVFSTDADLSCYLLSHITTSCEGFCMIPTIGWGREYVVAAVRAVSDSLKHDAPSEFAIAASQDNTIVTITASCDLRRETTPHFGDSTIAHLKGSTFNDTLKRGQTIQYKSTLAKDCTNYDVGGSIIRSTHPVGVVAGCQNAIDNCTWALTDYVADMLPPTRAWGKTYYVSPNYGRSLLVIGTKANQVIRRYDSATHTLTNICTLVNKFDRYSSYNIGAARWESDTAFMLVQYLYLNGGSPANVVIEPVEQFKKKITFQVDTIIGTTSYIATANIIVNANALASTTLDGSPLKNFARYGVDGKYYVYSGAIRGGAHVLQSDSGLSVNIQGYTSSEIYAWAGSTGTSTMGTADQTSPLVIPQNQCYATRMMISDTGAGQTGLLYIALDTAFNMDYALDSTWRDGNERTSTYYDIHVHDSTQPAQIRIAIYDYAGNKTAVFSEYDPQAARIAPVNLNFDYVSVKRSSPLFKYDTLVNQGANAFPITQFHFGTGDTVAFTIDSFSTPPLAPQERRLIKIGFWPKTPLATWATLVFGDDCIRQEVLLSGAGASANFTVTDADFGAVPIASKRKDSVFVINNSLNLPITIVDVAFDSSQFTLLPSGLPFTVAPMAKKKLYVNFTPSDCPAITSRIRVSTSEGDVSNGTLKGVAICDGVESPMGEHANAYLIVNNGGNGARTILPASWVKPVTLEIDNLLGVSVLSASAPSTPIEFDISSIPSGIYFYRITCGAESATGKIVIQN